MNEVLTEYNEIFAECSLLFLQNMVDMVQCQLNVSLHN